MTGTILNAAAIVVGGIAGLTVSREIPPDRQNFLKKALGIATVYVGLSMAWAGLNGSVSQVIRELIAVILALVLGKIAGRRLHLQHSLNRVGKQAKHQFVRSQSGNPHSTSEGFITCSLLFCAGPLGLLGALQDGLLSSPKTLLIKSVMDGLAAMAFAKSFGGGVLLSAIPVFAYQGTLTLLARCAEPFLQAHSLVDPISVTGGLLIFSVSLVILELMKVELADYLPSLIIAPLLAWVGR